MKVDLTKMQKKVDNVMAIFTNIINELNTNIGKLNNAIESNNQQIVTAQTENVQYSEKITEYEALRNKVESIVK